LSLRAARSDCWSALETPRAAQPQIRLRGCALRLASFMIFRRSGLLDRRQARVRAWRSRGLRPGSRKHAVRGRISFAISGRRMSFVDSSFIAQASTARENIDCFYPRNTAQACPLDIYAGGINAALRELTGAGNLRAVRQGADKRQPKRNGRRASTVSVPMLRVRRASHTPTRCAAGRRSHFPLRAERRGSSSLSVVVPLSNDANSCR
jgi:hypothetical protein